MNIERKYILLEKSIKDKKKWIRKVFTSKENLLAYQRMKRLPK